MENTCTPSPINKKEYISDIGKILVEEKPPTRQKPLI